jgi:hypothetical protein
MTERQSLRIWEYLTLQQNSWFQCKKLKTWPLVMELHQLSFCWRFLIRLQGSS